MNNKCILNQRDINFKSIMVLRKHNRSLSIINCGENEYKNQIALTFVMKFWVLKHGNIMTIHG